MTVRATKRRSKRVWAIDISYTGADGRPARYRRDSKSPTRAGAVAEERRILDSIARIGSPTERPPEPAARNITYAELVEEYRKDFMPAQLKVSTRRGYNEVLDEHLLPRFGNQPVPKIDGRAAHALDVELAEHAKTTRNNVQIVLRSTLRFAHRQGYIDKMPEGMPALKRVGQTMLDIPSDAEVHAIVTEAPYPLSTALKLMAYAGLRPNEVRGLRWRDVRLEGNGRGGGLITVRRGVSFGQAHSPKTGQRDVPIALPLYAELAEITDHELDEHVALMRDGRPLTQSALNAAFARLVRRLGMRHWPVYSLRHYAITAWLRAGVPVHVVQRMAGHSNLSTTARYTHMVQGDLERAVELFGNLLVTVPGRVGPTVRSTAVFSGFPVVEGEAV